ncbi:DNA-directed DNA polymerase [Vitreoscilla filiformis]|jgi:DNA polymerase III subunit epsilon|uniref:DNA polymerase III subunit epsilon n=1 Tax=Vitreoscilla filiformis TaxID=63 RepID=A0A221KHQ5_VITFI|nr:DNA polymerase III subunit epsilon [Vitreoscilla filiformis]ASM78330.1 DNA-directed DNA polymerase [Vitreoscilla filiformis]
MRQIFLDTETTGLSPDAGDRVVELACVEMDGRRLTGQHRHYYLNPERKNGEEAVRIHGLTDAFLADKPKFAEVADDFLAFVAGAELIIHNAAFDMGFLNAELKRLGRPPLSQTVAAVTDSLQMARETYPGKANSLDALCRRLEVDNSSRTFHGALLDCELLAEVYIRMTRGQHSLVIDEAQADASTVQKTVQTLDALDLRSVVLPVIEPDPIEAQAHEMALKELDKSSGGLALWRNLSHNRSLS